MVLNVITFICCYMSGLFVGTFFWTFIENVSKPFRQFTRRITRAIPWLFRRMIMWVMILICAYIGFFVVPWGYTRGGIFMGMICGIFIYMKAGVTLGKSNMPETPAQKKAAKKREEAYARRQAEKEAKKAKKNGNKPQKPKRLN